MLHGVVVAQLLIVSDAYVSLRDASMASFKADVASPLPQMFQQMLDEIQATLDFASNATGYAFSAGYYDGVISLGAQLAWISSLSMH